MSLDHVSYDQKPDDFRGTVRYASVHAHLVSSNHSHPICTRRLDGCQAWSLW